MGMPELLLLVDNVEVRRYPLRLGRNLLGRAVNSDIVIEDQTVSAKHAVIECIASSKPQSKPQWACFIQDLQSTNGTLVAGEKIRRKRLLHGDLLSLGLIRFRFSSDVHSPGASSLSLLANQKP